MASGLLGRAPAWMRAAFGLRDEEVPNEIPSRNIYSTLDTAERGWGNAQTVRFGWTMGASLGATFFDLLTGDVVAVAGAGGTGGKLQDPDQQYILWGLNVINNTATPGDVWLSLDPPGGLQSEQQVNQIIRTVPPPVAAGTAPDPTTEDFLGGVGMWLWCPPGWRFRMRVAFATGVGDSVVVTGIMSTYRAGFKVVP